MTKMRENEKLVGIDTMRSRIEAFHADRLKRIGREENLEFFQTANWSAAKVLKEWRDIPEGMTSADALHSNPADYYTPAA